MPTPEIAEADHVQALFDRIAPNYDQLNQILSLGLHQVWKGMTALWAQPPIGGTVLDVCCGSGDLAFHLARRVGRQGQVYGLDFSRSLLQIAEDRAQRDMPNYAFKWCFGDALDLPFPNQSFAGVTMGYGLRNVTDIPQALSEIKRVLQPGSWAAILDFHRPEQPGIRRFQEIYLDHVVVPWADQLGLKQDYAYINSSLAQFPTGQEQIQLADMIGFKQIKYYPICFGMMGVLVARKWPA